MSRSGHLISLAGAGTVALGSVSLAACGGGGALTYNGHPLYSYTGDSKPGDVNGQGLTAFGAAWFALSPSGSASSAR